MRFSFLHRFVIAPLSSSYHIHLLYGYCETDYAVRHIFRYLLSPADTGMNTDIDRLTAVFITPTLYQPVIQYSVRSESQISNQHQKLRN